MIPPFPPRGVVSARSFLHVPPAEPEVGPGGRHAAGVDGSDGDGRAAAAARVLVKA